MRMDTYIIVIDVLKPVEKVVDNVNIDSISCKDPIILNVIDCRPFGITPIYTNSRIKLDRNTGIRN
jgi:hypothetical protein